MGYRSKEPLGGEQWRWPRFNRIYGIRCARRMIPYDPKNKDKVYYGYGRQEAHAKPNSNQSSRSNIIKQISQLLLGILNLK